MINLLHRLWRLYMSELSFFCLNSTTNLSFKTHPNIKKFFSGIKNFLKKFKKLIIRIITIAFVFFIYSARPSPTEGVFLRTFKNNHRTIISAVEMYMAETGGKYPMRFDEVSKYLDESDLDGRPTGATYNFVDGILTSKFYDEKHDITETYNVTTGKKTETVDCHHLFKRHNSEKSW